MAVPQESLHSLYRGEAKVKKPSIRVQVVPNIVETYKYGNATVHIADNFIRTDPEEIQKVLNEYYAASWALVLSLRAEGVDI
jgi:hypothetical protein